MLVDTVDITVRAGRGGDGVVSFRREKFIPKGGPDGGDGGRGGSVTLRSTDNLDTLSSFRYHKVFQAQDGQPGRGKKMTGAAGDDLELLVPTGTIVTDLCSETTVADFTRPGMTKKVALGGKGGKGNVHFSTSTHQKPEEFIPGSLGEVFNLRLELRYVADIALIGEPNAGKSSIISALTGAEARIGPYPFSTTQPTLGVFHHERLNFTLVDLPGLISGAHLGKGLGDDFLRHTKRVKGFLHIVDASQPDPKKSIKVIEEELGNYDPALLKVPRHLVFNKLDLLTKNEQSALRKQFPRALFISVLKQENLSVLKDNILELAS